MTKTKFRIKDNSLVNKKEFKDIHHIINKIADKTLEQLEKEGFFVFPESVKDSEDLTREQMILQSVNEDYRSSNVMGFLGDGKESLVIESRFSTGDEDYFFQYLLERVLDFPNILELNTDMNQDNRLYNLLLFSFPYYLNKAMRKGKFKTYIQNQYNDSNVKGIIDIGRHIQENTIFIGNIAYNQREFSYDNYLMELVRHTIEFIRKKPYGYNLLRKVKEEVASVTSSTYSYEYFDRRKIIIANKKNPVRHAYFREYRVLQRLCIMILQHDQHQIGSGGSQIYGVLFDGAWLWEEYINSLIGSVFYHPMNKSGKGAQRLFSSKNRKVGLIYPDFISKNAANRIIADAKYKPIGNIGNQDYLQVLAYMFRFDANQGYFLYPENNETENLKLSMNKGSTYEDNVSVRDDISVIKYGLRIPKAAYDYDDFKQRILNSEELFLSQF